MTRFLLIGASSIVLILIFIIWKKFRKRRKKKKMLAQQAQDKLREEALESIILNKKAKLEGGNYISAKPIELSYNPLDVERASKKKEKKKLSAKTMLEITENSELSAKKYMFDPEKGIHIGNRKGKNDIVILGVNNEEIRCEIISNQAQVYVRNLGASRRIILKRGKQQAYVEKKYIEIKSKDVLLIENTLFRLELIKVNC